jgi:hypothetical protein
VRLDVDKKRADFEAAERKRIAEEREKDLQRVKAASDAAIRAAEDEARRKLNAGGAAPPKPEAWLEASQSGAKAEGLFERLDCLGDRGRITIHTSDGKSLQLLVGDPSSIVVAGGEKTLACGPQKPPHRVLVEYTPKADSKLRTIGEVTLIEFR